MGPGRVVIGDRCILDGNCRIITRTAESVVELGADCTLNDLSIETSGDVLFGSDVDVRGSLRIEGIGLVVIGDGCRFNSGGAINAAGAEATVNIGRECYLNGIDVFATEDVSIGERCIVGTCSFMTTDFHSSDPDRWLPSAVTGHGPIVVESNVWIASRVVILKGVTIGRDSVVSVATVVRTDVPRGVMVSSHEQRIVKTLGAATVDPASSPPWWQRSVHDD